MNFEKNKTYTGVIEKTIFGGNGLIKTDGIAIIIKKGIEGQEIEYRVTKKKKRFIEGEITKIINSSPLEIPLSEQKNALPGCTYQNISYENQLTIKHSQLKEIFRDFENLTLPALKPSPQIFGYRNKMEFSCGYKSMTPKIIDGKKTWKDEGFALGFHPPKQWAKVISIDDVFIASQDINIVLREIEKFLRNKIEADTSGEINPWNAFTRQGFWRGVILRESVSEKNIVINFVVSHDKDEKFWQPVIEFVQGIGLPNVKISGIVQTVHTGVNDAIVNPIVTCLWGSDILEEKLCDRVFEISPFSFFQTNTKGAEVLYSTITEKIGTTAGKNVLDLFCGTGSIGIFCAKEAKKVVGVEMIPEAVEMAKKNALNNGITNAEFFAGKAEKILPEILEKFSFDTVIIDPPRAGIHPKALQYICNLPIKKLVYVSCNPTTLARDAKNLEIARGWKLTEVQGVDMFPHTPHMECVSVLER